MKAYRDDLRQRIYQARRDGQPTSEVARRFDVSPAFVRRLMQHDRERGSIAARPRGAPPPLKLAGYEDQLRAVVASKPGITPEQLRDGLGLPVSVVTVWRMLRRLGLTRKKSR